MKKIRFILLFVATIFSRYRLAILLGLGAGVLSFFILPIVGRYLPPLRATKRIAVIGRYTVSTLPVSIQKYISIGLTSLTESGMAVPAISSSWEATDSGKTFVFTLRSDLRWQDGSKLTARDIQYNFRDTEVSSSDSVHLTFKLPDAYSPLPVIVSRPVFKSGLVGLGSYQTRNITKNGSFIDSLMLAPTQDSPGLPFLNFYFYSTEKQARTAYKLGLVQSIYDLQDLGDLRSWPNTEVTDIVHKDRFVGVFFNTESFNRNFRQALSYAVDKSRWPQELRSLGPINPQSWAYNPQLKSYNQDIPRAKSILAKEDKLPQSITLHTLPAYLDTAEQIKSDWEKVGIHTEISVTPDVPEQFSVIIIAQAIPADPDQYHLWHSTQVSNITKIKNPRIDKLLEDGRKTFDREDRKTIYQDFQKYLVEEAPAVFLYHPITYNINRS